PSCQKDYVLADELSGKYVRCQQCQQSFRVAASHPGPAPGLYADSDVDYPANVPPTRIDTGAAPDPDIFFEPSQPQRALSKPVKASAPWIGAGLFVLFLIRIGVALVNTSSRPAYTSAPTPEFRLAEADWRDALKDMRPVPQDLLGDRRPDSKPLLEERE